MSSTGPIIPKRCPTIQLSDLSDVDDFDVGGESGEIYGLQLTADGRYVRKPIQNEDDPALSLNELRDVNTSNTKNGIKYMLKKQGQKYKLEPYSDLIWDVVYTFKSGFTFLKPPNIFKKSTNEAFALTSLVPLNDSKGNVLVEGFKDKRHVLVKKDGVDANIEVQFIPQMPLPKQFTIILDLIAPKPTGQVNIEIISGLQISYSPADVTEEPFRFVLTLHKGPNSNIKTYTSNKNIQPKVTNFTKLDKINLDHIGLIAFYFSDELFTKQEIDTFIDTETVD